MCLIFQLIVQTRDKDNIIDKTNKNIVIFLFRGRTNLPF